jgi:enamine deaminase RidA (YjgF/YER057c/UK114 family)
MMRVSRGEHETHNLNLAKAGAGKCEGLASIAAEVAAWPSIGRHANARVCGKLRSHTNANRQLSMQRRHLCAGILGGIAVPAWRVTAAMPNKAINSNGLSYAQAHLVEPPSRLLFISGQVPADAQGKVPARFEDQCRLAWRNVETQLVAAGMTLTDLVKVTVFLSDRQYRAANAVVRKEVLGAHAPALTIIITGIYDEEWLLEIEAVAAT